jgi:hypothetical protein
VRASRLRHNRAVRAHVWGRVRHRPSRRT